MKKLIVLSSTVLFIVFSTVAIANACGTHDKKKCEAKKECKTDAKQACSTNSDKKCIDKDAKCSKEKAKKNITKVEL
jgi:hypothetical protein